MAETNPTPTRKPAARAKNASGKHRAPAGGKNRGGKTTPANQNATNNANTWDNDKPLPLAIAIRGVKQIVGRFCGKYPDRGFEATIDELMAYNRQLEQQQRGQKTMTAGIATA